MNSERDDAANDGAAGDDLRDLIAQAESMLHSLGGQTGEAAQRLRERVEATVKSARTRLASIEGDARELTEQAADTADRYVRGNPWAAVAIAAAAGVIVGALLSRRR
ncbi:MAG: YqjD family protein [Steroidobacteraceae bacterium]